MATKTIKYADKEKIISFMIPGDTVRMVYSHTDSFVYNDGIISCFNRSEDIYLYCKQMLSRNDNKLYINVNEVKITGTLICQISNLRLVLTEKTLNFKFKG